MFLDSTLSLPGARMLLLSAAMLGVLAGGVGRDNARAPEAPGLAAQEESGRARLQGPFEAQVLRIVDGDTFEARIRVWFGQDITTLVRLRGLDAPELASRCPEEGRRAEAARDHLTLLLTSGALRLRDVSRDKYGGRVVATAIVADDAAGADDVATLMLASGHARRYDGGRRASWCGGLRSAAQREPSFPSFSATR